MTAEHLSGGPLAQGLVIRPAGPGDVGTIHEFVVDLAEAEAFPGPVEASPAELHEALFGAHPLAHALIAEHDATAAGFALFYPTYSTILGRPGLHLEDIYVSPEYRGRRVGEMLMRHLALLAERGGFARLEWWVLRTNTEATRFYERLRARGVDEVGVMRLDGAALTELARASGPTTPRRGPGSRGPSRRGATA